MTAPRPLEYSSSEDLLAKLRPHVDGVILKAIFAVQLFCRRSGKRFPTPKISRSSLRQDGRKANLWRNKKLQVYVYQVEEFHEIKVIKSRQAVKYEQADD